MPLNAPYLIVAVLLNLALKVSAHGYVHQVTIDGKAYVGNPPDGSHNTPSIIRSIDDPGPVKGATNPFVNCGNSAVAAKLVANANPGSQLTFDWRGADLSKVSFCSRFVLCSFF